MKEPTRKFFSRQNFLRQLWARTNGLTPKILFLQRKCEAFLQDDMDCALPTTVAAPSPKGDASGRQRRPQGRSHAPPEDRTEAPRGYCWGHHLRSGRRRSAKTALHMRWSRTSEENVSLRCSLARKPKTREGGTAQASKRSASKGYQGLRLVGRR